MHSVHDANVPCPFPHCLMYIHHVQLQRVLTSLPVLYVQRERQSAGRGDPAADVNPNHPPPPHHPDPDANAGRSLLKHIPIPKFTATSSNDAETAILTFT